MGKTASGAAVPPNAAARTTEVDTKLEFDVEVPTSLALGDGHLTLSLGAEYDIPLDSTHKGKPTVQGTFEVSADDFVKLGKKVTLSPYVSGSIQDQQGQWSGAVKGGLELKVNIWKNFALKGDVNSGLQKGLGGLDPRQDPQMVIPIEGNGRLEISF